MKALLRIAFMFLLAVAILSTSYLVGFATSLATRPAPISVSAYPTPPALSAELPSQFGLFWEVWQIVEREFYGQVPDSQAMTQGAIKGALGVLGDEHTVFVPADHAVIFDEDIRGSFEGIGATVEMREGRLLIVAPLADSPAEKAGLQAGDIVVAVDGRRIENMTILEAIGLIRGPSGTSVHLTIQRPDTPELLEVDIVRQRIEVPVVRARMLEGDLAYVKLTGFGSHAAPRLENALRELLAQNPGGLILDLRNNPGGFLQVSVQVAGQFIDRGIILIERKKDGRETEYSAPGGGLVTQIPLVVLINQGTASASEIVAGAIQDHRRGLLIGETTFGKGSVQVAHSLSDGSSLRVTIAHWLTPEGRDIHEQGLRPDIEVKMTEEDARSGRDPQLQRAIEYLQTGH